jgi:predicted Rossmann-fold nucleotide-binding protein
LRATDRPKSICVYCASSSACDAVYHDVARRLGGILADLGYSIIYGGGAVGSMGAVEDMRARKHMMLTESDGVVALPGGSGTLEELLEALTLKRLGLYTNPIVLVNTRNYFEPLVRLFEHAVAERFMDPRHLDMWQVVDSPDSVPAAIEHAPPWSAAARDFAAI